MSLIQLVIFISSDQAEIIAELLLENNALSISYEDAIDTPLFQHVPEHQPLWPQVKLKALFDSSFSQQKIIDALSNFITKEEYYFEPVKDEDWVRLTQKNFTAQHFGADLWICPSWEDASQLSGKILQIDPGIAFGTGTHATTSLCLEWLANHAPQNKTVIDYGCGSGILALAALILGAKKAWAVDHDPQALDATKANADKNNLSQNLEVCLPENLPKIKCDLLLANILSEPLRHLAPQFAKLALPNSQLILSGILATEAKPIIKIYQKYFTFQQQTTREEWVLLFFKSKK